MNTHNLSPQNCERLSALADSELLREELATLLQAFEQDPKATESWNTYHVIGEVLRSPGSTVPLTDFSFMARFNQQLAKEPDIGIAPLALVSCAGDGSSHAATPVVGEYRIPASNDGNFRWKLLAGFACAMTVSAIAWTMNGSTVAGTLRCDPAPACPGSGASQAWSKRRWES